MTDKDPHASAAADRDHRRRRCSRRAALCRLGASEGWPLVGSWPRTSACAPVSPGGLSCSRARRRDTVAARCWSPPAPSVRSGRPVCCWRAARAVSRAAGHRRRAVARDPVSAGGRRRAMPPLAPHRPARQRPPGRAARDAVPRRAGVRLGAAASGGRRRSSRSSSGPAFAPALQGGAARRTQRCARAGRHGHRAAREQEFLDRSLELEAAARNAPARSARSWHLPPTTTIRRLPACSTRHAKRSAARRPSTGYQRYLQLCPDDQTPGAAAGAIAVAARQIAATPSHGCGELAAAVTAPPAIG